MDPILRLRKCIIRPYHESDVELECISKAANNPEIAKWMRDTFPHPYGIEEAKQWISIALAKKPLYDFPICLLDGRTVIGCIGLKQRDDVPDSTMEVGYWLGQDHWGQGIATEALTAFSKWTFENFPHVLRLEAEVFEGNEASARVLEKAGYKFESRRKQAIEKGGVLIDTLIYCKFRHLD